MSVQFNTLRASTIVACICVSASADFGSGPIQPLEREINALLDLEESWHTTLHIDNTPEQPITARIPIGNMTYTLELEPRSTRSDHYQVLMQNDEGELYEVPAGPIRTLRGSVAELDGSVVAASLMEDGLYARILLGNEEEVWLEPVGERIEGANPALYALYRTENIIPSGGICAADHHKDVSQVLEMLANYDSTRAATRGEIICTAQLGVDTDYEYYQDWGSQTEARINQVVDSINVQYEDEVNLTHEITTIIVRSSSSDPYTSNDAGTLLDQFASEWNNNQGSIPRDLAHLFTGRNLNSGTIGIAWLGVVCYTPLAYGLAQSDCCGSFGCTTDLSAHEMGHNWAADHVNSPSYQTMYPSLQCANQFVSTSINQIEGYANSVNCLSCANQAPLGACCIGENCVTMYQSQCDAGGGDWQGDNTTCDVNPCVAATGACCIDNTCQTLSSVDCYLANGTYNGDNSSCNTVSCAPGACCVDVSCSETLEIDCSGSWYGEGSNCADIGCGAGTDFLNYELRTWSRSDGQAMETYDLFFPSTDPNTRVVSVFGQGSDLLELHTWSNAEFDGSASLVALHHSPYGADGPHDRLLDAPFGDDLVYDAYVTVGSTDAADGEPLFLGFDSAGFNSAAGMSMDNGIWFVIPDDPMASEGAGSALGHRIASLSVESGQGIDILANVQWFDGADVVHESRNLAWNNYGLGGGVDCPTDIDGNGSTDVSDVLALVGSWGPCTGCAEDLNGDGMVDVTDLLQLIGAWGPCE